MQSSINSLRKDLKNNPVKLELLNTMYSILEENNFPDKIEIVLLKHYSSSLKKQIAALLGYSVTSKKISDTFKIRKL